MLLAPPVLPADSVSSEMKGHRGGGGWRVAGEGLELLASNLNSEAAQTRVPRPPSSPGGGAGALDPSCSGSLKWYGWFYIR